MKKFGFLVGALAGLLVMTGHSGAQSPAPANITFEVTASMNSLRDAKRKDTFETRVIDPQVVTTMEIECQAGRSSWVVFRTDETCSVTGKGNLVNPKQTSQTIPRTQYSGWFTTKQDGFTDGEMLKVSYLSVGKVPASMASFSGNMLMKPENPAPSAMELGSTIIKKIKSEAVGSDMVIDERVDTVSFSRLFVPSSGLPSDTGCAWSGDMVYTYQTESWFMDLKALCKNKEYRLIGNMPWTDVPDSDGEAQYTLSLALPNANLSSDDALFASAESGDTDLFASVDGISGTIAIKQSSFVTIKVDSIDEELASQVDASGTLTGTNVPVEVVRSLGIVFSVLSRTLFGA